MLFGTIIKQGTPFAFNEALEESGQEIGPVLIISNLALGHENRGQTDLYIKKDDKEFLVATLNANNSHVQVDLQLFIEDEVELLVKGPGSIHVVGSFEAPGPYDGLGDSDEEAEDDDDEEDDDEEEEVAQKKAALPAKPQQALKHGSQTKAPVTSAATKAPVAQTATKPSVTSAGTKPPAAQVNESKKSPIQSPKQGPKVPAHAEPSH